jgi:hypothetical protein
MSCPLRASWPISAMVSSARTARADILGDGVGEGRRSAILPIELQRPRPFERAPLRGRSRRGEERLAVHQALPLERLHLGIEGRRVCGVEQADHSIDGPGRVWVDDPRDERHDPAEAGIREALEARVIAEQAVLPDGVVSAPDGDDPGAQDVGDERFEGPHELHHSAFIGPAVSRANWRLRV